MNHKKKNPSEEIKKQLRLIESLAKRLPWIAVGVVFIVLLITLIQVWWSRAG